MHIQCYLFMQLPITWLRISYSAHLMSDTLPDNVKDIDIIIYLSLCLQTRTGQWAWWTTKSLTLPIIVRRNLPIPLVPVTTNVAFSFCATSTMAWPGLSAFSTLNSASICKNMLQHNLIHIYQTISIGSIRMYIYAYRSPSGRTVAIIINRHNKILYR